MADGTYLNGVEIPHVHKSNAVSVVNEERDDLQQYRDRLLSMAATSPVQIDEGSYSIPWHQHVISEMNEILAGMRASWYREFCAQYIIDNPDDVEDDLENTDAEA